MPYADTYISESLDIDGYSASRQIVLYSDADHVKGSLLRDVFPLNIMINSEEELQRLLFFKEEVLQLKPNSIIVNEAALNFFLPITYFTTLLTPGFPL